LKNSPFQTTIFRDLPTWTDYFRLLARAVHQVKVEDETAQVLVRQLRQDHAGRLPQRSPSPSIVIDDDDFYEDADSDDIPLGHGAQQQF
jgi:hypothetical protein